MSVRNIIICASSILIIVSLLIFTLLTNKITAEVPFSATYVPTTKNWEIHFSKSMNPNTFTSKTVQVINEQGEPVQVDFSWNEANDILTIKAPDDGYPSDQQFTIKVQKDGESIDGKQLSKTISHEFKTMEGLPNIKDHKQLRSLLKERIEASTAEIFTIEESADNASSESSSGSDTAPASATNIQVAGIDEGDNVKTNGDYIYFARDHDIIITSAKGDKSDVIHQIKEADFQPIELYLHKDLLISVGYSSKSIRTPKAADIVPSEHTTVLIYDIKDPTNPKQVREVTLEGTFAASRKTDEHFYLITNELPVYEIFQDKKAELRPFYKDSVQSEIGQPIDYQQMYYFPDSNNENFLFITSLDLDNLDKEAKIDSYLGASENMYMSAQHIYLAAPNYEEHTDTRKSSPATINTDIIQFNIADGGAVTYQKQITVDGTLINQFAMDEQSGTFRIATTKESMEENIQSSNNIYTFDLQLRPLGSVEGLAKGEHIFSVRFMENIVYLVTFEQIDPLFVIDLTDPKKPTVLGELKIPGFSNYLHPLDNNHVLGFGNHTILQSTNNGPQVRMAGLKLAIFDVSDPTNPKEKYAEILGDNGSYSELNNNHKALYQHPENSLFGFPAALFTTKTVRKAAATYEESSFIYEGAFLYDISPERGITLLDSITHQRKNIDYPEWEAEIKRILSVGQNLYTFSSNQVKVYDLAKQQITHQFTLPKQLGYEY